MSYHFLCKGVTGGAWGLAYSLGLALLVQRIEPGNVRAFGWVIAAYGAGNLAAVLVLGNMRRNRPALLIFSGYVWLGAGIFLWALSRNLHLLMASAAFAAIGGPLNDLPFIDIVQSVFPMSEIPKIFRVRMVVDTGSAFLCMLVSPLLFRIFSIQAVIAVCGLMILVVGLVGLLKFTPLIWSNDSERDFFSETV